MNEAAPTDSSETDKPCCNDTCRAREKSVCLAWAITLGEALVLAAATIALMKYWLMLPVRFRVIGVVGLAGLASFGAYRFVRFHRRSAQLKQTARTVEGQPPERVAVRETAAENKLRPPDSP